jgi:LuxR family maltose regulon positive regulatory protein
LLTGGKGGERVLQDLEEANAFVVPLDVGRSWFRYHHLFAGLLQLELRRAAPGEVAELHELAAGWFGEYGYTGEAVRHAQVARDWGMAARLLADYWPGLYLGGQAVTVHALLAGFPAEACAADAELAAVAAADELAGGSLEAAQPGLGEELRALALVSLGMTEFWAAGREEARRHLEQGVALARRIGRPYLEFSGLAYQASSETPRSLTRPQSSAGMRSSWPNGTAGPTSRPPATPTGPSQPCWPGRGGWRRQSPGCSGPSAPSDRKPSRRR